MAASHNKWASYGCSHHGAGETFVQLAFSLFHLSEKGTGIKNDSLELDFSNNIVTDQTLETTIKSKFIGVSIPVSTQRRVFLKNIGINLAQVSELSRLRVVPFLNIKHGSCMDSSWDQGFNIAYALFCQSVDFWSFVIWKESDDERQTLETSAS